MGSSGLEPPTSRLSGARSNQLSYEPAVSDCSQPRPFFSRNRLRSLDGGVGASLLYLVCFKSQLYGILPRTFRSFDGDDGIRTHDPLLAGQVLSQLSYTPMWFSVALFFGFNDQSLPISNRTLKIEQQALCTSDPISRPSCNAYCSSP